MTSDFAGALGPVLNPHMHPFVPGNDGIDDLC